MFFPKMPRGRSPWIIRGILMVLLVACAQKTFALYNVYCVRPDGRNGCYTTIGAAVAVAGLGDTVKVYSGTYREEVTLLNGSISLVAADNAEVIIDAWGQPNGIFVNGVSSAPQPGISTVVVRGFKVRNAQFEGILVVNATDVTIVENDVTHNDLALNIGSSTCPGIPDFETNEGDDCGEGIHLMGVGQSTVAQNRVWDNAGGILITDETGPSHSNFIIENEVHDNPYDCGITMASHAPATSLIPSATVSYGVYSNTVAHNRSWSNGTKVPGAGAGIGIFAPAPGTSAYSNVVIDNDIRDNGMAGVAMHNHVGGPLPVNFNDNQILGNVFSGNGADPDNEGSLGPTGISISSTVPIAGTNVVANRFEKESEDVAAYTPPYGLISAHLNNFVPAVGTFSLASAFIDDTVNWWNCRSGPVSVTGISVAGPCAGEGSQLPAFTSPWLTEPFSYPYSDDQKPDQDHDREKLDWGHDHGR
jgi:hypothetical protein